MFCRVGSFRHRPSIDAIYILIIPEAVTRITMPNSLYEIVMLPNGDIALQQVGQNEEPVVTLSFSASAKQYLREAQMDIARIMIDAGIDAVQQMAADEMIELMESEGADAPGDDLESTTASRTLH